jgi:hypothetical protein
MAGGAAVCGLPALHTDGWTMSSDYSTLELGVTAGDGMNVTSASLNPIIVTY